MNKYNSSETAMELYMYNCTPYTVHCIQFRTNQNFQFNNQTIALRTMHLLIGGIGNNSLLLQKIDFSVILPFAIATICGKWENVIHNVCLLINFHSIIHFSPSTNANNHLNVIRTIRCTITTST